MDLGLPSFTASAAYLFNDSLWLGSKGRYGSFHISQPLYSHYTGQPVLAGTTREELDNSAAATFYCLHDPC